jgi:hypothetical protein
MIKEISAQLRRRERTNIIIILSSIISLSLVGCASTFNGEINGEIRNIEEIKPFISDKTFLQLIEVPEGSFNFYSPANGELIYQSDLEKIPIPVDGKYKFIVKNLKSGKYLIAAQRLSKDYKYFGPLLWSEDKNNAVIINVETGNDNNKAINVPRGIIFSKTGLK